jgi:hypothetical protein
VLDSVNAVYVFCVWVTGNAFVPVELALAMEGSSDLYLGQDTNRVGTLNALGGYREK